MTAAAPFVLVHGGAQGGWVWRDVAAALRTIGHDVYTPSLTGFGERRHPFLALGLPSAYVVATGDHTIEPHGQEGFVARLPGAQRAEIATGHQCMNTKPAELSDILAAFAR